MSKILISYSCREIDFAQRSVTTLAENNPDTWIDRQSITKGEDGEHEVYRGKDDQS